MGAASVPAAPIKSGALRVKGKPPVRAKARGTHGRSEAPLGGWLASFEN
jgi:hypothetical protein